jgi:hypothetical protein
VNETVSHVSPPAVALGEKEAGKRIFPVSPGRRAGISRVPASMSFVLVVLSVYSLLTRIRLVLG